MLPPGGVSTTKGPLGAADIVILMLISCYLCGLFLPLLVRIIIPYERFSGWQCLEITVAVVLNLLQQSL